MKSLMYPLPIYTGVYIKYKSNGAKRPRYYWVVRELIPACASWSRKSRYKDHYPSPNTLLAAKKLQKQIARDRPIFHRGRKFGMKVKK